MHPVPISLHYYSHFIAFYIFVPSFPSLFSLSISCIFFRWYFCCIRAFLHKTSNYNEVIKRLLMGFAFVIVPLSSIDAICTRTFAQIASFKFSLLYSYGRVVLIHFYCCISLTAFLLSCCSFGAVK